MQHPIYKCYTCGMPTTLLRHSITETPEIARAVDSAQVLWPDASRAEVIRQLILRGGEVTRRDLSVRTAAIETWSGCLTGAYPQDAAARLKDEWPA